MSPVFGIFGQRWPKWIETTSRTRAKRYVAYLRPALAEVD